MYKNGKYIGHIYLITCLINNKVYVGQTRQEISNRWAGHKHDAQRREYHTSISKAIQKYGAENFKIELLEKIIVDTEKELNKQLDEREMYYIAKYHSLTHENGYNITKGGDNISEVQKVKTYCFTPDGKFVGEFESRADAGRFVGARGEDVAGAILRKGLCKGYYFTSNMDFDYIKKERPMRDIPIDVYNLEGKKIYSYKSCVEAGKKMNLDSGDIYRVCNGKNAFYHNYVFRYYYDNFDKYSSVSKRCKGINAYRDEVFYKHYNSIKEAGEDLNIKRSNISSVLSPNGTNKTAKGYVFYYADDPNQPDKTKII